MHDKHGQAIHIADRVETADGKKFHVAGAILDDGTVIHGERAGKSKVTAFAGEPSGGAWIGTIAGIEAAGEDVHLRISAPVPIAARASIDSLRALHLTPGARVTVRIDATAVTVFDDASEFIESPSVLSA